MPGLSVTEPAVRPFRKAGILDVLCFLEETTPARPNPLTRKRHGFEDPKLTGP